MRYFLGCGGSAQIGWFGSGCEGLGVYRQVSRTEVNAYGEKIEDMEHTIPNLNCHASTYLSFD